MEAFIETQIRQIYEADISDDHVNNVLAANLIFNSLCEALTPEQEKMLYKLADIRLSATIIANEVFYKQGLVDGINLCMQIKTTPGIKG